MAVHGCLTTPCLRCNPQLVPQVADRVQAFIEEADPVDSPPHYTWLPVEAIEITELFGFRLGNVLKYVMRADHKGKPLEDLKKALWYLQREVDAREAMRSE